MNLFCEEVHKLEAEFKQCRKLLNAIGDENRQHLICVMMNMPIDGGLVLEIVEQTHHPGCHTEGSTGCDAKRIKGDYPGRK